MAESPSVGQTGAVQGDPHGLDPGSALSLPRQAQKLP
jgi:hypothetical protein